MAACIVLKKNPNPKKKWEVTFPNGKKVRFGARGYSDYTLHKDAKRMKRYLRRHAGMGENWGPSGKHTAGWWSRWLLWSKPSMRAAKKLVSKKLGIPFCS